MILRRGIVVSLIVAGAVLAMSACASAIQLPSGTQPPLINLPRPINSHNAMVNIHAYVEQHREPLRKLLVNVHPFDIIEAARVIVADGGQSISQVRLFAATRLV